jgi:undecaprenyl-diphosphatase
MQGSSEEDAQIQGPAPVPAETVRLPERGFDIDRRKALIAAAVCWTGFALVTWLVATGWADGFDRSGLLLYRSGEELALGGHMRVLEAVRDVTALGGTFVRNLFAVGAVVALLFLKLPREAAVYTLTVVTGALANAGLKVLVGRDRPDIVPHLMEASGLSFPSGHSFNAAVVYIAMAIAFAAMSRRHSVRYTVIGAAMAVAALVSWSRVILGVHFPSDVIAGWLGGAGWAFLAAALLYRPDPSQAARTAPPAEQR